MKYLFLLGCHRSGTTLLQQALNRHSQIVIPPETKYFSSFLGHSYHCQVRRLARINRDLQIALPAPAGPIRGKRLTRQFFAQMADAYVHQRGKQNVVYFGEKTPAHSGYVPQIRHTFPEAKLLWLYRDGRDVALSMRKVPWMNRNLGVNFLIWLFYYYKQRRLARDASEPVLFVKYEDLVAQPVKELRRVSDFLELPFEPQVALGAGNREGILEWEYPWKQLALEPITCERVGVWRRELSFKEVEMLEWLGGWALRKLGYPLATTPSWWNVRYYPGIVQGVVRLFSRLPLDEAANQLFGHAICVGR